MGALASYVYYQKPPPPKPRPTTPPSVTTPVVTTEKQEEETRYGSSLNEAIDVKEEPPSKLPFVSIGILAVLAIAMTEGYFYWTIQKGKRKI